MKKKKIFGILIFGFLLRLFLLIINVYYFTLPQGGGDALVFEEHAFFLYRTDYLGIDYMEYFSSGARFLELMGSYVYQFTGREPLALGLIMVYLGTYSIFLTYKASYLLWGNITIAVRAALIVAVFPVLMLHSAIFLREIPVNVLLLLSIISFIKYWKFKRKKSIINFIFCVFFATLLHSGSFAILVGLVYFVVFSVKRVKKSIKMATLLILISALFIMNNTGFGLNKLGGSFDKSIELLQERENYELKGGSAYPTWLMMSGGLNDFWKIPLRNIAFLFSPLIPLTANSLWHMIGVLDSFLYLWMFYFFYRKREVFKSVDTAKGIITMMLFMIFVFSLGVSNVGTAIRHRAKIAPILIIVFVGLKKQNLKNEASFFI